MILQNVLFDGNTGHHSSVCVRGCMYVSDVCLCLCACLCVDMCGCVSVYVHLSVSMCVSVYMYMSVTCIKVYVIYFLPFLHMTNM